MDSNQRMLHLLQDLPTHVLIDTGVQATDTIEAAKDSILRFYGDTKDHNLKKLLQDLQLGDRKPSAALRQLQGLAPDSPNLVK